MTTQKQFLLALTGLSGMLALAMAAPVALDQTTVNVSQTESKASTPTVPTEDQPVWNDQQGRYTRFLVHEGAFHVLIDDLTGDGQTDLAFTSHGGNSIRVFRQVGPRRFEATEEQNIAGFHPNDTIALSGAPKRYLINAEGKNRLRVVAAQPDGYLQRVSDYNQAHPLGSTPFAWPDWGRLSLAVVPYTGATLTLLRDFDPEKGEARIAISIPTDKDPRPARLADLTGDGIPELVFPTFRSNKVWAVEHAGVEQTPRLRELASFKEGWPRHVVPLDVNQDGKMDLLTPMSVQERIAVLLNDGQGHFTEGKAIAYPGRVGIHTLAVGQDKGGRYLLAGGSRALVLYRERKEQPGEFDNVLLPVLNWPNRVELADVDGDDWIDAVVANQGPLESQVIYGPLWDIFGQLSVNSPDKIKPH
jgi:hypothetical protein